MSERRRALLIVNPYATKVSDRVISDVAATLHGAYDVETVTTTARGHAMKLAANASADLVVALGGDGTVNEVVNGLGGRGTPLSILPGGSTNVISRTLGIPTDIRMAARHVRDLADSFTPRLVDVGVVNGRRFVFACGAGLDAATARRVEAQPRLKSHLGPVGFTYAAVRGFFGEFVGNKVRLCVSVGDRRADGVTAVVQNSAPFAYFGSSEVLLSRGLAVDDGQLVIVTLKRANPVDVPFLMGRILVQPLGGAHSHKHVDEFREVTSARIVATGDRPFPVQVDGDYIGDFTELELGIEPRALPVLA